MIQEYKARLVEKKHLTMNVLEIAVELFLPGQLVFQAGQFVQFQIGGQLKAYSIISEPKNSVLLKFCVGLVEAGLASKFFKEAKVGLELSLRGPAGNFVVEDLSKNYFFVATGVGVAPFASIIPDLFDRGFLDKCRLLFGLRGEEDVFYFDRFMHLQNVYQNFQFTPILSQPQSHWPGEVGRVTTYIDVAYDYYKDYIFYISGRQQMADNMKALLLKRGQLPENIKVEIFV